MGVGVGVCEGATTEGGQPERTVPGTHVIHFGNIIFFFIFPFFSPADTKINE